MTDQNGKIPVLFSTIETRLGLPAGTVEDWATGELAETFPTAEGEGVAVFEDVVNWAVNLNYLPAAEGSAAEGGDDLEQFMAAGNSETAATDPLAETSPPATPDPPPEPDPEPELEVEWISVRIPIIRNSGTKLPARINQSFSLRGSDQHIRFAFGDVLEGCRKNISKMDDGSPVKDFSSMFRFIGEQISSE